MTEATRTRIASVLVALMLLTFVVSLVMMVLYPIPKVPTRRCIVSHTDMQVVALPGGASVGGVNVGGGLELAPVSVCDTSAVFDTLNHEIPRTRKPE